MSQLLIDATNYKEGPHFSKSYLTVPPILTFFHEGKHGHTLNHVHISELVNPASSFL